MMRSLFVSALLALLAIFACRGDAFAVAVGDKAIPIEGEDLNGQKINLGNYIGKKAILLKFGSIYCSTCVTSLEDIAKIQQKFSPRDLQIVGINLDVFGISRVRRFYRGYQSLIKYPFLIDEKLAASRPYDISSIPAHVIIDAEGVVRYVATGVSEQDLKNLEEALTKVIRKESGVEQLMRDLPLQVYLPQNFTKTYQDDLYVVGKTKPGSTVTVSLNGGSKQTLKTMRDMFYIRMSLSLGSNFIELSTPDEAGKKISQAIVIFREPLVGKGLESPFPRYYFHVDANESACKKCHDLSPPADSAQGFATATQFCLGCHKELLRERIVHGPIPIGGCAPCHQFNSKPHKYEPFAQGQDLCFKCHEEKRKDIIKTYLHGPLSAGLCAICHSPHGSSEKFQLRRYVGELCLMCHENMKPISFKKNVHKPVAVGECAKCHEPHSSDRPDLFLKQRAPELCFTCHTTITKMTHNHPWGVPPKMEAKMKLDKDGNLVCASCHLPHAGDDAKLMIKGGCATCHG